VVKFVNPEYITALAKKLCIYTELKLVIKLLKSVIGDILLLEMSNGESLDAPDFSRLLNYHFMRHYDFDVNFCPKEAKYIATLFVETLEKLGLMHDGELTDVGISFIQHLRSPDDVAS
jgi:hypothetical protein